MCKYKVLKPINLGGRREIGEEIEINDDIAKNIGTEYLSKISEPKKEVEKKDKKKRTN